MDRPIYLQIMAEIKRLIARGDLRPGDRVPSQRDLAAKFGVNPNTVQRVYREMERDGFFETRRGQGTFVRDGPDLVGWVREEMGRQALARFVAEMRGLGYGIREIVDLAAAYAREVEERAPGRSGG